MHARNSVSQRLGLRMLAARGRALTHLAEVQGSHRPLMEKDMTRYSRRGLSCLLVLVALPSLADTPPEQTIEFGFSRFFCGRIPLEEFQRLQPAVQIQETGWSRNPTRWYEPQLTTN